MNKAYITDIFWDRIYLNIIIKTEGIELNEIALFIKGKIYEKIKTELIGENGYSSIAAVVGATYPKQLQELRNLAPHTYFLIPGYGAQGGKAEDIALGFDKNGLGGIINASRSLMCAYKSDRWKDKFEEKDYAQATRAEAIRMRDELNEAIK